MRGFTDRLYVIIIISIHSLMRAYALLCFLFKRILSFAASDYNIL